MFEVFRVMDGCGLAEQATAGRLQRVDVRLQGVEEELWGWSEERNVVGLEERATVGRLQRGLGRRSGGWRGSDVARRWEIGDVGCWQGLGRGDGGFGLILREDD